jgi:TRAP-type C4-dicarboxylate transport system permease small subunit
VDTALAWAVVALMGLSVVNVLWQVFTRFVLGDPSAFTDELARILLIWVGLLGAAYAAGQRMHLAIDLLPGALAGRRRRLLGLVIQGSVLVFALGTMVYGGANLVRLTVLLEQRTAALGVSLGAIYSVLPIAGGLIAFYAVLVLRDHVRALRGEAPRLAEADESGARALADAAQAGPPPGARPSTSSTNPPRPE